MDRLESPRQTPSFSEGLRQLLHDKRMTQRELASVTGCKPQYVSQLLTGKRRPSPDWIRKAVQALGVPLQTLDPVSRTPSSERVVSWLEDRCAEPEVDAASFILYLRDPQWPDDFRLAASSGIVHMEPMHGLLLWPPRDGGALIQTTDQFLDYGDNAIESHTNQEQGQTAERAGDLEKEHIPEDVPGTITSPLRFLSATRGCCLCRAARAL